MHRPGLFWDWRRRFGGHGDIVGITVDFITHIEYERTGEELPLLGQ